MQMLDGRMVYSATDLNNYLECGHLIERERGVALRQSGRPKKHESVDLIARKGLEHEARYLASLRQRHPDLVEIDPSGRSQAEIDAACADTEAAMTAGAAVIYQGTFFDGTFLGKTDFLLRVERPCARWAWSYEVADTKLALREKPYFIIQLEHYSEHVARIQGTVPEAMHLVLGLGDERPFRVAGYAAYYRHLRAAFLADAEGAEVYPLPCQHCAICAWSDVCIERRIADDHLSVVADIRNDQVARLEAGGIATLSALARASAERPSSMREPAFARLQRQASLQLRGRQTDTHIYELLAHDPRVGFGSLPRPTAGDVFFDMEGDQFYDIGTGLEYLFGCYCPDDDPPFVAFWGTDRAAEKSAFEKLVDFLTKRRARFPDLHVYHYASYEKTALRKLSQRHETREDEVDALLRGRVLVDLFTVVRETLMISQPSYSIKKVEPFYGMQRTAAVRKGDDSIVMFERWLDDPTKTEILADIERYNEEDCISTWRLRQYLVERRAEYERARDVVLTYRPTHDPERRCHEQMEIGCKSCDQRERDEREQQKISADASQLLARDAVSRRLAHLMSYHRREEKPAWWQLFDRCDGNHEDLVEFDRDAIGGLMLLTGVAPYKRSPRDRNLVYTYAFPEQLHHLGDEPWDAVTKTKAGEIVSIDDTTRTLLLKRSGTQAEAAALTALVPGQPIVASTQKASLARVAALHLAGELLSKLPATYDLLAANLPRLADRARGDRIQPVTVDVASVLTTVASLDRSYLVVQGPPGTGKTFTGARVIVALLRAGKRVGVMATGHKPIHNMLHEIESVAADAPDAAVFLRGLHKHSATNDGSAYTSKLPAPLIASRDDNAAAQSGAYTLVSGTPWLFSREAMMGQLDYLFIDEAGQTALADAIAVAPSAQNIVLLGDPMQLSQVTQGSHPECAGSSVLEHLLGDAATVPPERGILLDVSYRMEPSICAFVSETNYDSRLRADPPTANNCVVSAGLHGGGIRYLPVDHAGNTRESQEEGERIVAEIDVLLRGSLVRRNESERALVESDILVVTPYNAQRCSIEARLRTRGYAGVRVGTVDKFQGQEAPVVFYSMATSSGEDVPRSMEFLFDRHRFNVAISRAQCLSVLVCAPALLDVRCTTVEQMTLANVLCRYVEESEQSQSVPIQTELFSSRANGREHDARVDSTRRLTTRAL